jgi:hypothetical protein
MKRSEIRGKLSPILPSSRIPLRSMRATWKSSPMLLRLTTVLALAALTLSLAPAHAADYAPLNCAAASNAAEKTICGHYSLGQQEARMATLYQWATSFVTKVS